MDLTNRKGANIPFSDVIDIHSVQTSVSSIVIINGDDNLTSSVNSVPSDKGGGVSVSSSDVRLSNSNLSISSFNNELHHTTMYKREISSATIANAKTAVLGGSNHVELPSGDGLLVSARQLTVPKIAVGTRPSVAIVYNFQGLFL